MKESLTAQYIKLNLRLINLGLNIATIDSEKDRVLIVQLMDEVLALRKQMGEFVVNIGSQLNGSRAKIHNMMLYKN